MTTKLRVKRFRIRRTEQEETTAAAAADPAMRGTAGPSSARADDGFGDGQFPTGGPDSEDAGSPVATPASTVVEATETEGLTGRQLRMARRIAQKNGIEASSDIDAVRQLRKKGIDPFKRANILDLVISESRQAAAADPASRPPGDSGQTPNLPQKYRSPQTPSTERRPPEVGRSDEILRIQQGIARRRQRRFMLLIARLCVFVFLPTLLAGYYYTMVATPLYTTDSEFVIQQAEAQAAPGGIAGMFSGTALATSQDSVTVQSYLQSRDAMRRLNEDLGFKAHFSAPDIDPLLRLGEDATSEAAYRLFKRMVRIGYDPSEGIIRMEVRATDPETSAAFSEALISYAEEQVDQLTQRLRADQMTGARESYEEAEEKMQAAQARVVELQERFSVLSSEVEVSLLTTQISALETELTRERLNLQELMSNPSPNRARVDPLQRRVANLETEIATLRARLTQDSAGGGISLARISSELVMAEADVQTRQLMLSQSLQQLESARIEANRQVRYLSLGVRPLPPDEPSHPRAFENTALALLVFAGIYLMLSMTASILREQVSA